MEFLNNNDIVFINCSYLEINDKKFPIINKVEHKKCSCSKSGTEAEGKFETKDYIIKYSKGVLYLYDKKNNLLGNYFFSKNRNGNGNDNVIMKFYLKKNCNIIVYNGNGNSEKYIKCGNEEHKVVKIFNIGEDTVYLTEKGSSLHISNKRNSKWNGIPIGKI